MRFHVVVSHVVNFVVYKYNQSLLPSSVHFKSHCHFLTVIVIYRSTGFYLLSELVRKEYLLIIELASGTAHQIEHKHSKIYSLVYKDSLKVYDLHDYSFLDKRPQIKTTPRFKWHIIGIVNFHS